MTTLPSPLPSVLLVDDEPEIREILQEVLQEHPCRIFEAQNGDEAIQIACQHQIDLLITDLIMPEKEGIETVLHFRQSYPGIKIIAISGSEQTYLNSARLLGADAALRKPLNLDAMSDLVGRMLGCPTA